MSDEIMYNQNDDNQCDNQQDDGIDRRGFLKCMAWAGTGVLLTMRAGVLESSAFGSVLDRGIRPAGDFSFAQVSDSHIGFSKPANTDVVGTFQEAVKRLDALPTKPDFVIHTGDVSHLSKPEEFDTAQQVLRGSNIDRVFYVPGEHDVLTDDGKRYREQFARDSKGAGWYSFDHKGCHFIGLVNVMNLKAGGMGSLGPEQLEWLEKDLKGRSNSTPIVVFAHIPLWTVYPEWGWGTDDSAQALSHLKRFGSVTVLNGHIHQTLQKVEGNVTFHTACSTAFPQPKPGAAPSPGPMKVPAEQLRSMLGLTSVKFVRAGHSLAIIDSSLESKGAPTPAAAGGKITIDNFAFAPADVVVKPGATVTWINHDDIPHIVVGRDRSFRSPVLDTDGEYSRAFSKPGAYEYFCSIHPHMTGKIVVRA
jgi:Icc protein